jgi:SAM-dependent methyltransferase
MNYPCLEIDLVQRFSDYLLIHNDLIDSLDLNSVQTKKVFSEKWKNLQDSTEVSLANPEPWMSFQFEWFLKLYGFEDENDLSRYLQDSGNNPVFIDAGCGKGYKAACLASLSKKAVVYGIDFSDSVYEAANTFSSEDKNICYIKADIASIPVKSYSIDLILCDQVLHHTHDPAQTLNEFQRILKPSGKLLTYAYRKKALPRELLDEYFRNAVHDFENEDIWNLSEGMTKLGKVLSEHDMELDLPDIPALGVKGGRQSLQRYLYWNFFKCFWNSDLGYDASVSTNFDWYSPSIAYRYSEDEFKNLVTTAGFKIEFFHEEEACFSGRFEKIQHSV